MRKSRRRLLIAALAILGMSSLAGSTLAGVGVGVGVGVGDWRYNYATGSQPTHFLLLESGGKLKFENGSNWLCDGC